MPVHIIYIYTARKNRWRDVIVADGVVKGPNNKEMMLLMMLEWLGPFIYGRSWDYAVVWKLGDDPAGVIEWVGCCCSRGRKFDETAVKEEKAGGGGCRRFEGKARGGLGPGNFCRDGSVKHRARSTACKMLLSCPCSLPLYSGIHGEVLLLNQAAWISSGSAISEEIHLNEESNGTRVLIPVYGGVIELFTEKNVPEDKNMIELVIIQSRIFSDQLSDDSSMKYSPHIQLQSTEHLGLSQYEPFVPRKSQNIGSLRVPSPCRTTLESNPEDIAKPRDTKHPKGGDHCFQSKNLMTERKRRQRIKDGLFALRSLVPNISKMDTSAIIGDAIVYIKKLQQEVNDLEEEARSISDEEYKYVPVKWNSGSSMEDIQDRSSCIEPKTDVEVQVEVYKVRERGVVVRLVCRKTRGWFARVVEKLGEIGFAVKDVNVTTFDGKVLAILMLIEDGEPVATAARINEWRDSLMKAVGA